MKPDFESFKVMNPEAVITPVEAAKLLGMTRAGYLLGMKRGDFPYKKIGSRYFTTVGELAKKINVSEAEESPLEKFIQDRAVDFARSIIRKMKNESILDNPEL